MPHASNHPRVSIIIRTFNEQFWLPKLLEKIKDQSYKTYDVVLVDNCSTDKTVDIFEHYFPKNRVITIKSFNPAKAINLGIKKSNSIYIVIISAHCVPKDKFWLSNLVSNMHDDKVVACYGRQIPLSTSESDDKRDLLNTFGVERRIQKKDTFFHNANSIIKKAFWKKFPFDESVDHIEDRIWAKNVIKERKEIIYDPSACVYHYHGINHSRNTERVKKIAEILSVQTLGKSNKLPYFMQFNKSRTLYCILGHSRKNNSILNKTLKSIESLKNDKMLFVYSEIKGNSRIHNSNIKFFKKNKKLKNSTFVEILGMLLKESYKIKYFPDCVNYINLNSNHLDPKRVNDSVKIFYSNMYDTTFFAETEYKQIWTKNNESYLPIKHDYAAPKGKKTPYYVAEYGMGTATKPNIIDNGSLIGKKIAILKLEK